MTAQETDIYAEKAFFAFQQNQFDSVLIYADSSVVRNYYLFTLQGDAYMKMSNYKHAISNYKQANIFEPNCSAYELALCYAQIEKYDSTYYYIKKNLSSSYKKMSNDLELHPLLKGFRASKYWNQIKDLKAYSESEKSLERAIYYSEHNELELALDILDELVSEDKKNPIYYYYRAQYILQFNKDYKYAIGDLKKSVKYDNTKVQYFEFLGDCYLNSEKFKKASEAYLSAIKLYPYSQSLKYKVSLALMRSGNFTKAEKYIRDYININDKNVDALKLIGLILFETEKFQDSVNYLYKATSIAPRRGDLLVARGKSYMGMEDFMHAGLDFGSAIDLDSRNGEFWYYKGLAFLYSDRKSEACKYFTKARYLLYYKADEYLLKDCQ